MNSPTLYMRYICWWWPLSKRSGGDDNGRPLDAAWEIGVTVVGTVLGGVIMLAITKKFHDRRHAADDI